MIYWLHKLFQQASLFGNLLLNIIEVFFFQANLSLVLLYGLLTTFQFLKGSYITVLLDYPFEDVGILATKLGEELDEVAEIGIA